MPGANSSDRDEVVAAALAGIREVTRLLGKRGVGFTPVQIDELIRATRTLMGTIEFKARLAGAVRP